MADLLDHTEQLLRREIASWPDGTTEFTDYMDSDGIDVCDVPLHVTLTVRGDELIADFSDSAPMVRGALNCTPSFAEAAVYHTVMAASAIDIPRTAGATRPITVITKPGTVTHVLMPGASSMRGITGYRLSDVMNGALAQLIPDRVPAAGEGGSTLAFFTGRVEGEPFVYSELVVGTWGGRPVADGNDGLANPCASMANIPVELAESDWPIMIERYGLVTDSGGAGPLPRRARGRAGLAGARARTPPSTSAPTGRCTGPTASPAASKAPRRRACSSAPTGRSSGCRRCSSPRLAARRRPPPPDARRRRLGRPVRARARGGRRRTCSTRRSRSPRPASSTASCSRATASIDAAATDDAAAGEGRLRDARPGSSLFASAGGDRVEIVLGLEPAFPVGARASARLSPRRGAGRQPRAPPRGRRGRAGDVIVLAVGGEREIAHCGEIIALAALERGIAGIVLDGAIRDRAEIAALGFPVFCRGTLAARAPARRPRRPRRPGRARRSHRSVRGDLVCADADGVAIVAAADAADVQAAVAGARGARAGDRRRAPRAARPPSTSSG